MVMARSSREAESMKPLMLFVLSLALACGASSGEAAATSTGGETTSAQLSEPGPVPAGLPRSLEGGVMELYRLANGARYMAAEAIREECDGCWAAELDVFANDDILTGTDLQPAALAESLQALIDALEPLRDREPFGALVAAFEDQRDELLTRSEPFEPNEVIEQTTAALAAIRAAISAEAALTPAEPVLCSAAVRLGSEQLDLWELELTRAAGVAEQANEPDEGMRIIGIITLSREHFEDLSIAMEAGPEEAVTAIRSKLIFFRSFDSVFDRGDDEAVLEATANLCEPLSTTAE